MTTTNDTRDASAPTPATGSDADFVADTNRSFLSRLYTGTGAFEIVGRRRMWYLVSLVIVIICVASIAIRGFSFGIEFEGGTQISIPVTQGVTSQSVEDVTTKALGSAPEAVQTAGSGASQTVQVRTDTLTPQQASAVTAALTDRFGPELTNQDVSSRR